MRQLERVIAWAALLASGVVLARSAFTRRPEDVLHYYELVRSVAAGGRPYVDAVCEYPPYALAWLLWPSAAHHARIYVPLISLSFLPWHLWATSLVLREAERMERTPWSASAALSLAALPVLQSFWFLRRFDAVPTALTVIAVVAAARSKPFAAGLALAAGALTKVFPIVIAPVLLAVAIQKRTAWPLALETCLGALPAMALLLIWPWWRFAEFHATRGLQAESLAASLLWLGRHLVHWDVRWASARASYEIHGGVARLVLPWATAAWAGGVAFSTAVAGWSTWREKASSSPALARLALLPVLAFVAWSPVLSPQYMIWLQVLAALALLEETGRLAALLVLVSAAVTPTIYPSSSYCRGLDLVGTAMLVARNLALVIGWGLLLRKTLATPRPGPLTSALATREAARAGSPAPGGTPRAFAPRTRPR